MAKLYGVEELPGEMKDTYGRINYLLVSEADKYNVGKYLKKKVDRIDLATVEKYNKAIPEADMQTGNASYEIPFPEIENLVKNFNTGDYKGYGFLLVAQLLNKSERRASYLAVIFNTETKEIVKSSIMYGKGRGFGLRNYWTNSVRDVIKNLKPLILLTLFIFKARNKFLR